VRQIFIVLCCLFLIGCNDRVPIEEVTLFLVLGIDYDENDQLLVSISTPSFEKGSAKTTSEATVKATSLRDAFKYINSKVSGIVSNGKTEVILIGEKVIAKNEWFKELDLYQRDPRSSNNAELVLVEGKVKDVISTQSKEKTILATHLMDIIHGLQARGLLLSVPVRTFSNITLDKGVTATLPIIKKEGDKLGFKGTALLDELGQQKETLSLKENNFLNLLRSSRKKGAMTISLSLKDEESGEKNNVSVLLSHSKRKVNISYEKGKFVYNIHLEITGDLIEQTRERLNQNISELGANMDLLSKQISIELNKQLGQVVSKFQQAKVDPIGLGQFAKAYEHAQWKKVEDNWGEVLSNAEINVSTEIRLHTSGLLP
jgi:spore germination protein AC